MTDWRISDYLAPQNASMLKTYRDMPGFLPEHFGIEQQVLAGWVRLSAGVVDRRPSVSGGLQWLDGPQ